MCKYCEEEFIYHNDDVEYYIMEDCSKCGMETFKKIEDSHCDDLDSYSLTKYLNACEMEHYLTTICQCNSDKSEYLLVTVKEYIEVAEKEIDYRAWLSIEGMEIDVDECNQCGNEKDLYYEVNIEEESASLSKICPKCNCLDKYDID